MQTSSRYVRRMIFASAAAVTSVLGFGAHAQSPELEAYAQSKYGFCDAKKIAAVWKKGVGEAKAVIGAKILGNLQDLADADIASTKDTVSCDWDDTGLTFDDAMKLAAYWGRDSIEAKQKAAQMTSELGNKKFLEVMADALGRT